MNYNDMVYGTSRRESRRTERGVEGMGHDMMDLGKLAVGGMVTVGVLGALGSAFKK